ncbi:hypothetical protein [Streptomyces sp. NPDC059271]|uniref:hypothetical protein n=1 Tax=Streptomyces sp. NPDC059271 TaxID=3346799 RepID=UPI003694FE90
MPVHPEHFPQVADGFVVSGAARSRVGDLLACKVDEGVDGAAEAADGEGAADGFAPPLVRVGAELVEVNGRGRCRHLAAAAVGRAGAFSFESLGVVANAGRSRLGPPPVGLFGVVEAFPAGARVSGIKALRQRISKNYADAVSSVFRTMLDDSVAERLRGDNPVATRKSGRRGKFKPKPKDEKTIATPRQVLHIARNALQMRGLNEYAIVLASAYTGLRIGESAGVHRDQLGLKDAGQGARLHSVQQLIDSRPDGEWVFTAPKGGRLLRGGDWYAETWQPIVSGRAPRGVVRGARARVGVPPVLGVEGLTAHALRHSQKVWLDEGNHPRVVVEARMGHVLQGVEGTYSHVTLAMEMAIAEGVVGGLAEGRRRPPRVGPVSPTGVPQEKTISQASPKRGLTHQTAQ